MKNITIHIQIFFGIMNSLAPAAPGARKSLVYGNMGKDKDAHKEKKFWIGKIIKNQNNLTTLKNIAEANATK